MNMKYETIYNEKNNILIMASQKDGVEGQNIRFSNFVKASQVDEVSCRLKQTLSFVDGKYTNEPMVSMELLNLINKESFDVVSNSLIPIEKILESGISELVNKIELLNESAALFFSLDEVFLKSMIFGFESKKEEYIFKLASEIYKCRFGKEVAAWKIQLCKMISNC